ncbi:hypothetical protein QFC20_007072 [Naganishia adeliensis]|uniref:Uncharacterized protein n=1 Tax=Naganishia adeliensis TaxID=92952 RepID=A0ACC2V3K0_9TREE|nr:hypothetical protein QFC20_007072 [Naganishia adeliensis]
MAKFPFGTPIPSRKSPSRDISSSPQEALEDVVSAGPQDPTYEAATQVIERSHAALKRQYHNIRASLRLANFLLDLNAEQPCIEALLPAIPQHALLVWRQTLKEASSKGISINTSSWHKLNTKAEHECALELASDKILDDDIQWSRLISELMSWIFKFHESPGSAEMVDQLIRRAYADSPEGSIRFWPAMAQSKYLCERLDANESFGQRSCETASVASIAITAAFQSVSETKRYELVRALGFQELASSGNNEDAASANSTGSPTPLPEEVSILIKDYLSLMAPMAMWRVVVNCVNLAPCKGNQQPGTFGNHALKPGTGVDYRVVYDTADTNENNKKTVLKYESGNHGAD